MPVCTGVGPLPGVVCSCRALQVHNMGCSLDLVNASVCVRDFSSSALIDREDPSLSFVVVNPAALSCVACVELDAGSEYLLCFNMVGIFVSGAGCRSRTYDINWPSSPQSIGKPGCYLFVC